MEVKFHVWEWEEELRKLNLENVGLGNTPKKHLTKVITQLYLLLALIINSVGLVVSIIVFVIEKIIHNT